MPYSLIEPTVFRRALVRAVILPLALMAVMAVVLIWQFSNLLSASEWVLRADRVIAQSYRTQRLLDIRETQRRGYLLTGSPNTLALHLQAEAQIDPEFDQLARLVARSETGTDRVEDLRTRYEIWRTQTHHEVELKRRGRPFLSDFERSRVMLMSLRARFSDFIIAEETVRDRRLHASRIAAHRVAVAVVGVALILGVILALVTWRQLKAVSGEYGRALTLSREQADALRRSEEQLTVTLRQLQRRVTELQTLLDVIPIGIGIAEEPDCSDIRVNPTFAAMLGISPDINASKSAPQADVLPFRVLKDGREVPAVELPMQRAAARGFVVRDEEYEITHADGTSRYLLEYAAPLPNEAGTPSGAVGAFVDITERRQTEEALRRHQAEIEALNERLRRAMIETHHRVKNNLQVIAAMVDLHVMDGQESVSVEEFRRLGRQVNALATVHDILTQEAKEDGDAYTLSARAMLEKLLPILRHMAANRRFEYALDDARLTARQGTSLALVANELVSNAVKYGRSFVHVRLTVKPPSGAPDNGGAPMAVLEVRDDGPGFPEGFDPGKAANTGLDLVESLSRWDLDGQTRYERGAEGGGRVSVVFPVNGV